MYYSKEQLEKMRREGEERLKKLEEQERGFKYESENDIQVICIHCKHDHFHRGSALLNTRGMTFFDLDWLNESATTLICARCGYIQWFGKEVKQV
jgi:predicted nucleic-acid-binding Zn-ribbon protein